MSLSIVYTTNNSGVSEVYWDYFNVCYRIHIHIYLFFIQLCQIQWFNIIMFHQLTQGSHSNTSAENVIINRQRHVSFKCAWPTDNNLEAKKPPG